MNHGNLPHDLQHLLEQFSRMAEFEQSLPGEDTPIGMLTHQFFRHNWKNCQEGLLRNSSRIRVWPWPHDALLPCTFKFQFDLRFKSKRQPDAPVELRPGPLRGTVYYRPDLFVNNQDTSIAVTLDHDQTFFHPNYSRQHGVLCLGELPESPYPFPLDLLLENIVFPIVSYQIKRPVHPFDLEAAKYFALDPDAMQGIDVVEPLY